jgi:hypothetical protein
MRRVFFKTMLVAFTVGLWGVNASAQTPPANKVFRFVPHANLAVLDPIWTTAYITRNHGFMCYDTLFGVDEKFVPQPQMAEGIAYEDGNRRATITLRADLRFGRIDEIMATGLHAYLTQFLDRVNDLGAHISRDFLVPMPV